MDAVILSRVQFALFIAFHYLFVPLSIGLSMMLIVMEALYLITKKTLYQQLVWFWIKIFSLTFVVGVVTGIMQIFSFGSNWSVFSEYTGNIFGTLLGSEGIFAFFLESGFLGVLLFGRHKVSNKVHFFSVCMVALGAHLSAFWIICANSWMQTPSGYEMVMHHGKLVPAITSFWKVVFSPSTLDRFTHAVLGTWLSGIFLVISVSAYYFRKQKYLEFARKGLKIGLISAAIVLPLQLLSADSSARGVAKNQPAKLAAFEGIFKTEPYSPLWVIGYVDMKKERVIGVQIPGGLSFLVHRNIKTPVIGLDQFPKEEWPNVQVVFQLYHFMVMSWGAMVVLTFIGWRAYKGKRWALSSFCLFLLTFSVLIPQACNELGWGAAEMGRQPWVVQGLLKTKDAVSPNVQAKHVLQSLIMFSIVFVCLLSLFLYLFCKKVKEGPDEKDLLDIQLP